MGDITTPRNVLIGQLRTALGLLESSHEDNDEVVFTIGTTEFNYNLDYLENPSYVTDDGDLAC